MKLYFKGFDELRAIGALSVIFGHIELIKSFYGVPNLMSLGFYKNTNGHIGVILFFVLSGFLITHYLIKEIQESNTINVNFFYFKRLTRIWPLYYLMIFISIYILPKIIHNINGVLINYSFEDSILYFLFLPNIAKNLHYHIQGASHLWSIGVEEQFYLIWPLLVSLFKKKLVSLFVLVFILFSIINPIIDYSYYHFGLLKNDLVLKNFLNAFFSSFKINCMALGGLFAFIHNSQHSINKINKLFFNRLLQIATTFICINCWIFGITFGTFTDEIYSFFFVIIIYNVGTNQNTLLKIENITLKYLGKISFGLYVYHWVVIVIIIEILKNNLKINNEFIFNTILYTSSLCITILISNFSFDYFEKPIINLKHRFKFKEIKVNKP